MYGSMYAGKKMPQISVHGFLVAIMAASQRMDELREAVSEKMGHGKRDNGADLRVPR